MANIVPLKNGDVVTLTLWGTLFGSRVLNVLHYQATNMTAPLPDGESEINNLVTQAITAPGSFGDLLLAQQSFEYTLDYVRAQKVFDQRYPYFNYDIGLVGGTTVASEPSNVDAVITKRSAHVGRGTNGAYHVPGIPRTGVDGALLTGAYKTSLQAAANLMDDVVPFSAGSAFWQPIVGVPGSLVDPSTDMIDAVVQKEVRVMVKRTAFRGI